MNPRVFASRNLKELLRDPLNFFFALGFPLVVLLLLTALQANIPQEVFPLATLAPGIAVFGLSFISLFSGMLLAKDRSTSFLIRLMASPMRAGDFILGYLLPLVPLALAQTAICLAAALLLGLPFSPRVLLILPIMLPAAIFFISTGLLAGTLLNDKQVGGVCGALLTNLTAWLSGAWFDLNLVGGAFRTVSYLFPFAHAVDAGRAALTGSYDQIIPHLLWVTGYALIMLALAVFFFRRKMKSATL